MIKRWLQNIMYAVAVVLVIFVLLAGMLLSNLHRDVVIITDAGTKIEKISCPDLGAFQVTTSDSPNLAVYHVPISAWPGTYTALSVELERTPTSLTVYAVNGTGLRRYAEVTDRPGKNCDVLVFPDKVFVTEPTDRSE